MTPRPMALAIQDTIRQLHQLRMEGYMPSFTITDHPSDYPDYFVARMHLTSKGATTAAAFAIMDRDVERLRTTLEALGLVKMDRSPEDDPVILETWI